MPLEVLLKVLQLALLASQAVAAGDALEDVLHAGASACMSAGRADLRRGTKVAPWCVAARFCVHKPSRAGPSQIRWEPEMSCLGNSAPGLQTRLVPSMGQRGPAVWVQHVFCLVPKYSACKTTPVAGFSVSA